MTPKTVDEPQCGRLGGLGLESPSYGELLVFGEVAWCLSGRCSGWKARATRLGLGWRVGRL
ncbi:MAG: hypothetical protein ACK6EB_38465, partial [Planctomyces sp.]